MKNETTTSNPNYALRRTTVALALGATVLVGAKVGLDVHNAFDDMNTAKVYSQFDLVDHLGDNVDPSKVMIHVIGSDEHNPIDVANAIGAENTMLVAGEVAGQVGGADSMNIGEKVVIPLDQIEK